MADQLPRPRDVATRMRAIEDNITVETGEDTPSLILVMATLCRVRNQDEELVEVLIDEVGRVNELLTTWYVRHGVAATMENALELAFVQGATFAVAAQRLNAERGEV